jgi:hypothetical protein
MAYMPPLVLRRPLMFVPLLLFAGIASLRAFPLLGDDKPPAPTQPLKLPADWNPRDPLPIEKSNCMRCHLTAGRELTVPVRDFVRSVHDLAYLSCNDCHGGNTKEDSSAHEEKHGFIGTKLSAHMSACTTCHPLEARWFQRGKHYWDLSRRINRDYPVCIDCHGAHDIGRPPAAFSMTNVCTDCHKQFAKDFAPTAAVIAENDRLWQALRKVHARNNQAEEPTPAAFRKELKSVRTSTSRLIHGARPVRAEEAEALNQRVRRLREKLEGWLKEQP